MSHSAGPQSIIDMLLASVALIIVLWAFYLAIRYTFRPGEESPDHIKRRVLDDESKDAR